jgi:phage shock protein PspC (stress-responsive transcriptional regulator)
MTTNEPFGPDSPDQPEADQPHSDQPHSDQPGQAPWGDAPSAPPSGAGSDAPHGSTTPPGARFFDRVRAFGAVRPDPGQGRILAGVAAGIARKYGVDPLVARIVFVLASLVGGVGILAYGLGWMFLPHPDGRIHAQQVLSGTITAGFVGSLLTVLLIAHHLLPFLLVALVIWLVVRHRRANRAQPA